MSTTPHAPPVRYPLGHVPFLGLGLVVLWVLVAAPLLAWSVALAQGPQVTLPVAVCGAAWVLWAWAARRSWHGWRRQPACRALQWDGAAWSLREATQTSADGSQPLHHLQVRLDGQHWVLLSAGCSPRGTKYAWQGSNGLRPRERVWLWARRAADPQAWPVFRSALYAPAKPAQSPPH